MKILTADEEGRCQEEVVCTGITEIDRKLGGGIPLGSLTLIEGQSDAGKSVISQQLISGSLNSRHRVLLFTNENTIKSMERQMASLGMEVLDYLLLGQFKIFTIEPSRMAQSDAFDRLIQAIIVFKDMNIIVIDSLTPAISQSSPDGIIGFFERCKKICDTGRTIINVAHTYAFDEQVLIRIRSACDAHIRVRIEEVGDKLVKILEVAKVRGADKSTGNIMSFDVEPGVGMRMMPLGKAKA